MSVQANIGEQFLPIQNGIQKLDLDGDGQDETIIKAWRGNANAHGYHVLSFYKEIASKLIVIPVEDISHKGFNDELTTYHGAECTIRDYRLWKAQDKMYLIQMQRKVKENLSDKTVVQFQLYRLLENEEVIPGTPEFYLKRVKTEISEKVYCDVNEALIAEGDRVLR